MMKVSDIILVTAVLTMVFTSGCKDVFEEDLQDKVITVISPADSLETTNLSLTFWWNELEGATQYNLQIVSPGFSSIQILVLDTTITTNKYDYTLSPGTYQWRVRGENENSQSLYTTSTFFVDSTSNLSGQTLILSSPATNSATNSTNITFSWLAMYNADDYRFEIRSPDWNGSLVLNPEITSLTSLGVTLGEGSYAWGVQGQNSSSSTAFTVRTLMVDTTDPGKPSLLVPSNNQNIHDSTLTSSQIFFQWSRGVNTGSSITDSLFISTDSVFSSTNLVVEMALQDTILLQALSTSGYYFWRVRSVDKAGNLGVYSNTRKFYYEK